MTVEILDFIRSWLQSSIFEDRWGVTEGEHGEVAVLLRYADLTCTYPFPCGCTGRMWRAATLQTTLKVTATVRGVAQVPWVQSDLA